MVKNGTVMTPRLKSGILPGVTRSAIFELASQTGLEIVESDIRLSHLLAADEAFLTNSLIEIMPLTSVDGKSVGDGSVGPKTMALAERYRELVLSELRAQ